MNDLMEEYHIMINQVIRKYPGSLRLNQSSVADKKADFLLNALGAILRQKIVDQLYAMRKAADKGEAQSPQVGSLLGIGQKEMPDLFRRYEKPRVRKQKPIPRRIKSFLITDRSR